MHVTELEIHKMPRGKRVCKRNFRSIHGKFRLSKVSYDKKSLESLTSRVFQPKWASILGTSTRIAAIGGDRHAARLKFGKERFDRTGD
jgi:hypothetical protein